MNDDNDSRQSADDALEPVDDIFNPAVDEETLDEDGATPAAPADDTTHKLSPDDPRTDTDVDEDELYSEGLDTAAGSGGSVVDSDNAPAEPLEPEE